MNELIKVTYDNDRPVVSARELHDFLEVKTAYKDWFPRMCEYGFTEGTDFNLLKNEQVQIEGERTVTRHILDAALTIDMAKEICMIQRSEKGKQARQYFIQLEKDWNSPEKVMARALNIAHRELNTLKAANIELLAENAANKPKVIFADAVSASERSILVGELAKLLRQNGVEIGQNRLFDWMRQKGFLIRRQGTDYNMPTQKAMELGLFEIKETSVVHSAGNVTINKTPKVTGKGQVYFISRFLSEAARSPQADAAEM